MLGVECVHLFEDEADGVLSDLRDVRLQLLDLGVGLRQLGMELRVLSGESVSGL